MMLKIWTGYLGELRMLCEITDNWDDVLSSFPCDKKDIYFTRKYVDLYATSENKAVCVICRDGDRIMLMPFLRGEVNGYYDFETAYGYGGPVSNVADDDWNQLAFCRIYDYLKENNYLCGLVRFHPLFNNFRIAECKSDTRNINVIYDRQTVAIDTSFSEEEIWSTQINSKNRNMIRKAEKNGLEYRAEFDFASFDEFIALYSETMTRLNAYDFYFFDNAYFQRIKEELSGSSFLGTVRKDDKLVCAAIFMYSEKYGHYHLAGSDRSYSGLGANNFLLWKAACEMHALGVSEFHLGGGTSSSPDDSLYKFKKAFSPNGKNFHIAKVIFNAQAYSSITKAWEEENQDKIERYAKFLLRYRY